MLVDRGLIIEELMRLLLIEPLRIEVVRELRALFSLTVVELVVVREDSLLAVEKGIDVS